MFVTGFPAAAFGTNCYVLASGPGQECVVVDPGTDVGPQLDEIIAKNRLKPVAVLLTHGHIDHTFSVTPVCGARGIPAWIHPGDRHLLVDPMSGLSAETKQFFGGRLEWSEPDDIKELVDGAVMDIAGMHITVDHAPGHTQGSVMFRPAMDAGADPLLISGDVLFREGIGRTDLPGGSPELMQQSLRAKCLTLADNTVVLPGHGDSTTIGYERTHNPFIDGASAPNRGL